MTLQGNILYLHVADLLAFGIPKGTYDAWQASGKVQIVADRTDARRKLIPFSSIPPRTRKRLPTEAELRAQLLEGKEQQTQQIQEQAGQGIRARVFDAYNTGWTAHLSHYLKDNPRAAAEELARAAALLQLGLDLSKASAADLQLYLDCIAELKPAYLNLCSLPYLRRKLKQAQAHPQGVRGVVYRPRVGNKNRQQFDEVHQAIALDIYANGTFKFDFEQTHRQYADIVRAYFPEDIPVASLSTLKQWLNRQDIKALWWGPRHGRQQHIMKFAPQVHRYRPQQSWVLLSGDGIMVGESIKRILPNGKQKSDQLTAWLWYDVFSEAIVGYEIDWNESTGMIRRALRRAVRLHDFALPQSIQLDVKLQKNPEVIRLASNLGIHLQKKQPYSPWQSYAERINKEFNKYHRASSDRWVDLMTNTQNFKHNEDARRDSQAKMETEARQMIIDIINLHNHEPLAKFGGRSRIQMLEQGRCEGQRRLDELSYTTAFSATSTVTPRNGIIRLEVETSMYEYEIPDWTKALEAMGASKKLRVYYDEEHLDKVWVFAIDPRDEKNEQADTFLAECLPLQRTAGAVVEQNPESLKVLGHHMQRRADFEAKREAKLAELRKAQEEAGLEDITCMPLTGQDRYKQYLKQETAKLYQNDFNDTERHNGRELVPVRIDANDKQAIANSHQRTQELYERALNTLKSNGPDEPGQNQ